MGLFERLDAELQRDLLDFVETQEEKEEREGRAVLGDSIKATILRKLIEGDCKITGSVTSHEKKKMWVEFTFYAEDDEEAPKGEHHGQ